MVNHTVENKKFRDQHRGPSPQAVDKLLLQNMGDVIRALKGRKLSELFAFEHKKLVVIRGERKLFHCRLERGLRNSDHFTLTITDTSDQHSAEYSIDRESWEVVRPSRGVCSETILYEVVQELTMKILAENGLPIGGLTNQARDVLHHRLNDPTQLHLAHLAQHIMRNWGESLDSRVRPEKQVYVNLSRQGYGEYRVDYHLQRNSVLHIAAIHSTAVTDVMLSGEGARVKVDRPGISADEIMLILTLLSDELADSKQLQ